MYQSYFEKKEKTITAMGFDDNGYSKRIDRMSHPRTLILHLGVLVGNMCNSLLHKMPFHHLDVPNDIDASNNDPKQLNIVRHDEVQELAEAMAQVLCVLFQVTQSLSLNLEVSIIRKMELNSKKYPVELCKGKVCKYTFYSHATGISKTEGQSTLQKQDVHVSHSKPETISSFLESIDSLTVEIRTFAVHRQWVRYYKPRNLVLALMGELGELAELFQWAVEEAEVFSMSAVELDKVSQEIADVAIYLLRLADTCNVDLKAFTSSYLAQKEEA